MNVCISSGEDLNRILVSLLCLGKKKHIFLIQPSEELQPVAVTHGAGPPATPPGQKAQQGHGIRRRQRPSFPWGSGRRMKKNKSCPKSTSSVPGECVTGAQSFRRPQELLASSCVHVSEPRLRSALSSVRIPCVLQRLLEPPSSGHVRSPPSPLSERPLHPQLLLRGLFRPRLVLST